MILLALHITICYKNKANKMSFFKKLFGKTEEQMTDNEDPAIPNTNMKMNLKTNKNHERANPLGYYQKLKLTIRMKYMQTTN
ncbi:MAG: hypothetical protein R2788_17235 [Saprospiraceae bacterium]